MMLTLDPEYPAKGSNRYKVKAHTVSAVSGVVRLLNPPTSVWSSDLPENVDSAMDVFIGYVMLDMWIANQDRHHENWAAVWDGEALHLAPTFDHGAALARNLSDQERLDRLTTKDRN